MVDEKIIFEIIDNIIYTNKCRRGEHSSNNPTQQTIDKNPPWMQGQNVEIKHFSDDEGKDIVSYNYQNVGENNDTTVNIEFFDNDFLSYPLKKIIITDNKGNTKELNYMNESIANDFFAQQKDQIIDEYGEEGWEFFTDYASMFATYRGWELNSYLRGLTEKSAVDGYIMNNHERFLEMENHLNLSTGEDYMTLRVFNRLHENDDSDKRIVSDKAHISTTVGADISDFDIFAEVDNIGDCYRCISIVEQGSKVPGAYFGTAISEGDFKDNWEVEVNYAPNNKFERLFVDEKNKIIVQVAKGV